MNNGNLRNFIVWVILAFSLLGLYNLIDNPIVSKNQSEITFSQLLAEVDAGNVVDVEISGDNISGHYSDGRSFKTFAPSDPTLIDRLYNRGVSISAKPEKEGGSIFLNILISWFPMLLLIAVWIFFMRQMQGGGGKAMGFGKSKAKLLNGISNSTYQPSESKLVSQSQIVSHVKSGRLPALTTPSAFPPPPATPK